MSAWAYLILALVLINLLWIVPNVQSWLEEREYRIHFND